MAKRIYTRISPEERVMSSLDPDPVTGCLNFTGSIRPDGYGQVQGWRGKKPVRLRAHRIAWEVAHHASLIDTNIHVCHRCDNPRCCNPDHLFLGSSLDNMQDMVIKGRQNRIGKIGEKNGRAILTELEVAEVFMATESQKSIGARYGIKQVTVSAIKTRKCWQHVTAGLLRGHYRGRNMSSE